MLKQSELQPLALSAATGEPAPLATVQPRRAPARDPQRVPPSLRRFARATQPNTMGIQKPQLKRDW